MNRKYKYNNLEEGRWRHRSQTCASVGVSYSRREYRSVEKECHNAPHAVGMQPCYDMQGAYLRHARGRYESIFYRAVFPTGMVNRQAKAGSPVINSVGHRPANRNRTQMTRITQIFTDNIKNPCESVSSVSSAFKKTASGIMQPCPVRDKILVEMKIPHQPKSRRDVILVETVRDVICEKKYFVPTGQGEREKGYFYQHNVPNGTKKERTFFILSANSLHPILWGHNILNKNNNLQIHNANNISPHLKNIFTNGELNEYSVTEDFSVTAQRLGQCSGTRKCEKRIQSV